MTVANPPPAISVAGFLVTFFVLFTLLFVLVLWGENETTPEMEDIRHG